MRVQMSMSKLELRYDPKQFVRTHKSLVVNKALATEMRTNSLLVFEHEISIGWLYHTNAPFLFKRN